MTAPSPVCQIKDGSGSYGPTTNGALVTPGNTVSIQVVTPAGVNTWAISCTSTDDANVAATINAGLTIDSVNKIANFAAPAMGSALIFTSTVNGGVDANGSVQASYTTTFKIYTLTAQGKRVMALGETFENNATFGWAPILNDLTKNGLATTGTVQTSNGSATTIITVPLSASTAYKLKGHAISAQTNGTAYSSHEIVACIRRNGSGSATQQGSTTVVSSIASGAQALTWAVSGNNALLQVAGIAATTINWTATVELISQAGQ